MNSIWALEFLAIKTVFISWEIVFYGQQGRRKTINGKSTYDFIITKPI
jgi:hypothetical protein